MKINSDVKILYEDNHLLVVEKPVNMLTQGDATGDADLLSILKQYIKEKYNKPGNVYLGLVHRLDRPVGGVMVFARTSKAASRLSDQVRKGTFGKVYLAVVRGKPPESGRLKHYLYKDNATNMVRCFVAPREGAKEAVLEYEVLESLNASNKADVLSLIKIDLLTGRPHQIRAQFSFEGFPLYGDQKYGKGVNKPGQQLALWSTAIKLVHPTLKEDMVFKSFPPDCYPWNQFKILVSAKNDADGLL
ncbi:23S rRNA pseudouridine1911/1915/1917 synthase [Caldicoprobacter guelmensis]|uniref:RluA family pseudouridine synthase n=1 Tax=Caldicoprobacter guelmensis TaxID=1170224 RepID=UPI001956A52C|nr:RluA family pseudouridine synthase [Caldicoprobacter guelmensis]MBM7581757.1 23S rRNA pseudouridine1911/1915/1917 synthase [Caldicoprobacter guelmensis]